MKFRSHKKNSQAFTLIELLVVITIMGILAAIAVPAIKNIGKGHATASASRQMLDEIAHARQLAIAQHTTVYMVFVPMNFWNDYSYVGNAAAWSTLITGLNGTTAQETARTLLDRQMASYTFVTLRSIGDQPGKNSVHYLSPWRTLPEGMFIVPEKFLPANPVPPLSIAGFQINNLNYAALFPFPAEQSPISIKLPYIAFNYLGQLESGQDEYIPLAQGHVNFSRDGDKVPQFTGNSTSAESPVGNSTNAYALVHIDWITGRARIEQQQVQ